MKAAIDRSRKLQTLQREQEREHDRLQNIEFAEFWKKRNLELQLADEQEKEEVR